MAAKKGKEKKRPAWLGEDGFVVTGTKVKFDVGEFSDKKMLIDAVIGETTIAEALAKAGLSVEADKKAADLGWRLNGRPCKWTDKVTSRDLTPTLYRLPKGKAGAK